MRCRNWLKCGRAYRRGWCNDFVCDCSERNVGLIGDVVEILEFFGIVIISLIAIPILAIFVRSKK